MTTQPTTRPTALRRALQLDAATSGTMGVLLVLAADAAAQPLGLSVALLRWVGVILIPFAAYLVWIATRARDLREGVRGIVWTNVVWSIGSVLLLATGVLRPTLLGELFVLAQAVVVAAFAYVEYVGLRRAESSPGTSAAPEYGERSGR
jgi:hypothetical protein